MVARRWLYALMLILLVGFAATACSHPPSSPSAQAIDAALDQHRPVFIKFYTPT